jgi:hypothetical protein
MDIRTDYERGDFNPLIVVIIILGVMVVGLSSFSVWAYINYNEQKNNVDQKVGAAVAEAKRLQAEEDETKFAEREKLPTRQFVGPDDFGHVSFQYPKTWSAFVSRLGTGGANYEAYLQPGVVPPLDSQTPYALRITILDRKYESVLNDYQQTVKDGKIRSTQTTVNGDNATRMEGQIEQSVDGVMILAKIRDKTLKVYTESRTFQPDLDNTIIPSLQYNR